MTFHATQLEMDVEQITSSPFADFDARTEMLLRLPGFLQPLLTWLTAKPPSGDPIRKRSPLFFVWVASLQTVAGGAMAASAMMLPPQMPVLVAPLLMLIGLVVITSGLGLFQVVIFHHCSHGTVFEKRERNITVGRLISCVLLFKHFDEYSKGHMLHHSNNKLLTEEDEFADFVFGLCGLRAGLPKRQLWRQVILSLLSPIFHAQFLIRRVRGAWCSHDPKHNYVGMTAWAAMAAIAAAFGRLDVFLVAWVLPVSILLQIATVFRILCEHRFPDPELIRLRGRDFACHATAGVFAGAMPPARQGGMLPSLLRWSAWWANMLTVQLLVRVVVLVGDAPCHDYHHRRPASRRWTSYIQARQIDVETNASGFRTPYQETWGLFRALDQNLASLARTPSGFMA